jgi:signal transduction histidine kinase
MLFKSPSSINSKIAIILGAIVIPVLIVQGCLDISWRQESYMQCTAKAQEAVVDITKECAQAVRPMWDFLALARKLFLFDAKNQNNSLMFTRLLGQSSKFVALMVVDQDGKLLHGSTRASLVAPFVSRPFIQKVFTSRNGMISPLMTVKGYQVMLFAIPVQRDTIAILAVDARWFQQLLNSLKALSPASVALTDRYGTVLASNDDGAVIGKAYPDPSILGMMVMHPEHVMRHARYDGVKTRVYLASIEGSNQGLRLCVSYPEKHLYGAVDQLFIKRLLLALLVSLLVWGMGLYLARRWILRPMWRLMAWVPKASTVTWDGKMTGEFGRIIISIQQLAQSLREQQKQVAQSTTWFERILNAIGVAVLVVDTHQQVKFFNQSAIKLGAHENLINAYLKDLVVAEQQETFESLVGAFIASHELEKFLDQKFLLEHSQGIPVRLSLSKIVSEIGVAIVVLIQPVSQEATRHMPATPEVGASIEEFAYMASHDFQEPLRMITIYLDLLKNRYRQKLDQDANDFIDFAADGAARLQNMMRELLNYARAGRSIAHVQAVDTTLVLEHVLADLQGLIQEAQATIEYDRLPAVAISETEMAQIFMNLISNALKFRKHQHPLHINVRADEHESEFVFSIEDNGIGFDNKFAEKIFGLFQRLHNEDSPYHGTGIGLATIKKLIENRGGRVWAESHPNQGATFYFTVPKFLESYSALEDAC